MNEARAVQLRAFYALCERLPHRLEGPLGADRDDQDRKSVV